jgi:peroxiredoxin
MAGWGLGLSVAGMLACCLFGLIYYAGYLEGTEDFDLGQDDYDAKTIQEWIGESAPDFTVTDVEGNEFTLSKMTGRRVALNFWWPSSLLCRDAVDHFVELRKSVPKEKLVIMGISLADAGEVQGVGRRLGINYPLVSTDDLPSPYDKIYGEPTTIFIDRDGIVQSILEDYHDFEKLKILSIADDYEKGKVNDPNT